MGGHHSQQSKTEVWLTPPHILQALGPFDLDPCAAVDQPWPTAGKHYTINDDGLSQPWCGRVWLNPPYGRKIDQWMRHMAAHNHGIALIFARTETAMFFESVWPAATGLMFLQGRVHFHFPNGTRAPANAGAPSVLIAYGEEDGRVLERAPIDGAFVRLRP